MQSLEGLSLSCYMVRWKKGGDVGSVYWIREGAGLDSKIGLVEPEVLSKSR